MDKDIQALLLTLQKDELFRARFEHYTNLHKDVEEELYQKVVAVRKKIARTKSGMMANKEVLAELLEQRDIVEMEKLENKNDEKKLNEIKKKLKTINQAIEKTIIEISKTEDITERGIKL